MQWVEKFTHRLGNLSGKRRSAVSSEAGLTLLEMIVVLAIIAIVAGLVVPNVIGRPDQARVTVARADMQSVAAALKLYRLDSGSYPTTSQGLKALVEKPIGGSAPTNWNADGYLDRLPLDPWNRAYEYKVADRAGGFELKSLGADGRLGGEGPSADLVHAQK